MTTNDTFLRHSLTGGWATDFGPTVNVSIGENGEVNVPFLVEADNLVYELDGGLRKAPGATKLNSSALESGANIKGVFDAWFSGTGGGQTQHRVIHISTKIKEDDADGTFADLFTGLDADKVPSYAMLEDLLVIASNSTADVPKSWDGSTAQDLAGTPPNFAFVETHQNRMWAAGNAAKPSRLYYCALLDPADWVGSGSGSIDIEPSDGDVITGLASHKNELWVFKGPRKGSIHRITGSAPTGSDAFARTTFVKGLGAVGHNTIFRFIDDLGFMWSDGSVHSLKATSAFGDFNETALTRPIQTKWIGEHVNFGRLKHACATNNTLAGHVLLCLPIDSSSQPNIILMMDYRFNPVRWSKWSSFADTCVSLGAVVDSSSNDRIIVMAGGNDGFVRKLNQKDRSIDTTKTISFTATMPFLTYQNPAFMKTIGGFALGIEPKNNGNITLGWTRDDNTEQTQTINQGGTAVLGTSMTNQFTLGTSKLGGSRFVDRFTQPADGGEFRSIQYRLANNVLNEDVEIHSLISAVKLGAASWEN